MKQILILSLQTAWAAYRPVYMVADLAILTIAIVGIIWLGM